MKTPILALLFVLGLIPLQSQIVPFKGSNGKIGLKNEKQKIIAQPIYTKILVKDKIYVGQGNYIPREIQIVPEDLDNGKLQDSVCLSCEFGKIKNISIKDFINSKPYILVSDSIKYGILDPKTAKEITELKYESIEITYPRFLSEPDLTCNINSILCIIHLNGKTGVINAKTGNEILPMKYVNVSKEIPFLVHSTDKHGLIDSSGKEIFPVENQTYFESRRAIGFYLNNRWVFTDKNGKIIPQITLNHFGFLESDTTTIPISMNLEAIDVKLHFNTFKKILINKSDKKIINFYYEIGDFKEGYSTVNLLFPINLSWRMGEYVDQKYGLIDSTGKEIIGLKYDGLNVNGNLIEVVEVDVTAGEKHGRVEFSNEVNRYGVINKAGREIIPIKYSWVNIFNIVPNRIEVTLDGKRGIFDTTGKQVLPIKYDEINSNADDDLIAIKINNKWGYVDNTGKEITPLKYEEAGGFYEQLARVRLNQKWGFIDKKGQEIIPLKYDEVGDFYEQVARACLNHKWGFINKTGQEIIPLKYNAVGNFSEGLVMVANNKWGFVDKNGKEVIQLKYDGASDFKNGKARVHIGQREFLIDKHGTEIRE